MLPVFIGIGLGVLLGSIPSTCPVSRPPQIGSGGWAAGGGAYPVAIGSIGKLYWFMPPSANLALREIGIVLFLAVVGFKSGPVSSDT